MNVELREFAKQYIRRHLISLPQSNQRIFKLMYGRNEGKRSIEDAEAMNILDIVDEMNDDKLDWAMTQIKNTLAKQ